MNSPLCKYSNMFGRQGEGVHKYRFMGIAIVDVVITIIVAFIVAWFMKWSVAYTVIGVFIAGIIVHRMFCVRTALDKLLFG